MTGLVCISVTYLAGLASDQVIATIEESMIHSVIKVRLGSQCLILEVNDKRHLWTSFSRLGATYW